jgi:hypothetical protein
MSIQVDVSSLSENKLRGYELRFLFGGTCTAVAGLIASKYGPVIGGLFLAFPAIFPAAASLIQNDEKRRKAKIGKDGSERGRNAAALDAFGATLGCLGLVGFALLLWKFADKFRPALVLGIAFAGWALIAFAAYLIRQHWPRLRPQ